MWTVEVLHMVCGKHIGIKYWPCDFAIWDMADGKIHKCFNDAGIKEMHTDGFECSEAECQKLNSEGDTNDKSKGETNDKST
jgi:hypothetical protein